MIHTKENTPIGTKFRRKTNPSEVYVTTEELKLEPNGNQRTDFRVLVTREDGSGHGSLINPNWEYTQYEVVPEPVPERPGKGDTVLVTREDSQVLRGKVIAADEYGFDYEVRLPIGYNLAHIYSLSGSYVIEKKATPPKPALPTEILSVVTTRDGEKYVKIAWNAWVWSNEGYRSGSVSTFSDEKIRGLL